MHARACRANYYRRQWTHLASFAYRFNRRYDLNGITQRLAWAGTQTKPHPYRVIIAG